MCWGIHFICIPWCWPDKESVHRHTQLTIMVTFEIEQCDFVVVSWTFAIKNIWIIKRNSELFTFHFASNFRGCVNLFHLLQFIVMEFIGRNLRSATFSATIVSNSKPLQSKYFELSFVLHFEPILISFTNILVSNRNLDTYWNFGNSCQRISDLKRGFCFQHNIKYSLFITLYEIDFVWLWIIQKRNCQICM